VFNIASLKAIAFQLCTALEFKRARSRVHSCRREAVASASSGDTWRKATALDLFRPYRSFVSCFGFVLLPQASSSGTSNGASRGGSRSAMISSGRLRCRAVRLRSLDDLDHLAADRL
jgi:hypothetical protein